MPASSSSCAQSIRIDSDMVAAETPKVLKEAGTTELLSPDSVVREEDFISELPEDIFLSIISLLTSKEAVKTGLLSTRWRAYINRLVIKMLEIDDYVLVSEDEYRRIRRKKRSELGMGCVIVMRSVVDADKVIKCDREIDEIKQSMFVSRANLILKSHHDILFLNEFRICCSDEVRYLNENQVGNWIKFASEKKVQKLHLQVFGYKLTTQFLSNYNLDSLIVLTLSDVGVIGRDIKYILSSCPSLEELSLQSCRSLVCLKVCGRSSRLKSLKITHCHDLGDVKISTANLEKFEYAGKSIRLSVKAASRLVEVSISGFNACFFVHNVDSFPRFLSRLEILELDLRLQSFRSFPRFPELRNLKRMELKLQGYGVGNLLHCTKLLDIAPLLQIFRVEIFGLETLEVDRDVKELEPTPHDCLKLVELHGFVDCTIAFELALCLIRKPVSLDKFVIDIAKNNGRCGALAKTRAKQLEKYLSQGAELVIL